MESSDSPGSPTGPELATAGIAVLADVSAVINLYTSTSSNSGYIVVMALGGTQALIALAYLCKPRKQALSRWRRQLTIAFIVTGTIALLLGFFRSPSSDAPPLRSLEVVLDNGSTPPQRSIDLDTLTIVSAKDPGADIAFACQACTIGEQIAYSAMGSNNTLFTRSESMDPTSCSAAAGYGGQETPIQTSTSYCVRTQNTYAVIRITSATTIRPNPPSSVVLRIDVASRPR